MDRVTSVTVTVSWAVRSARTSPAVAVVTVVTVVTVGSSITRRASAVHTVLIITTAL